MRTLFVAGLCIVVTSGAALACRGTVEFPQVSKQLEQSAISPARLNELMARLGQGQSAHEEGHRQSDMSKMAEGLRILDGVKREIGE